MLFSSSCSWSVFIWKILPKVLIKAYLLKGHLLTLFYIICNGPKSDKCLWFMKPWLPQCCYTCTPCACQAPSSMSQYSSRQFIICMHILRKENTIFNMSKMLNLSTGRISISGAAIRDPCSLMSPSICICAIITLRTLWCLLLYVFAEAKIWENLSKFLSVSCKALNPFQLKKSIQNICYLLKKFYVVQCNLLLLKTVIMRSNLVQEPWLSVQCLL